MHEMGIAMQIIQIAIDAIPPDAPITCVQRVNLKIGKLSAIVPESLQFCFSIAAADTVLAGAELVIEEVPIVVRCNACQNEWRAPETVCVCSMCGSGNIQILSGRELFIESIEVADSPVPEG
jgi:hydrogenase nickel incorporation protein HypA/HybF